MIKLIVAGAKGRMGQTIIEMATRDKSAFEIIYEFEALQKTGKDADLSQIKNTDVVIDFTSAAATSTSIIPAMEKYGLKSSYVVGSTGFSEEQERRISNLSTKIPIVKSSNMSLGMNILSELVAQAARLLKPMNMTVEESHHRHKIDAPSGSAKMLGRALASAVNLDPVHDAIFDGGAHVSEEEAKKKIFFNWRRSSEIVGEHTVFLGGWGEELRLGHAAHNREPFAAGALHAAKWVVGKKPGLYSMRDVLGLNG